MCVCGGGGAFRSLIGGWGEQVLPRFKLRSEGQQVAMGDEVQLCALKSGHYLHASRRAYEGAPWLHEVCGSAVVGEVEWTLRVHAYADFDAGARACVLGGDLVRFWHAEAEAALVVDTRSGGLPLGGLPLLAAARGGRAGSVPALPLSLATPSAGAVYVRAVAGADPSFGDTSNALWVIELDAESSRQGGPVTWRRDESGVVSLSTSMRLRHVGTGLYLCAAPAAQLYGAGAAGEAAEAAAEAAVGAAAGAPAAAAEGGKDLDRRTRNCSTVSIPADVSPRTDGGRRAAATLTVVTAAAAYGEGREAASTLFRFESTQHEAVEAVSRNATVRLRCAGTESAVCTTAPLAAAAEAQGVSLTGRPRVFRVPVGVEGGVGARDRDTFIVRSVVAGESEEVLMALSARPGLARVVARLNDARAARSATGADTLDALGTAAKILGGLIAFVLAAPPGVNPLTVDGTPRIGRQRVVREQGLVALAARLLELSFEDECVAGLDAPGGGGGGGNGGGGGGGGALFDLSALHEGRWAPALRAGQYAYRFLSLACKRDGRNARSCARWMRMFMNHSCRATANADLGAEEALGEVFNADRGILEREISTGVITDFLGLLREKKDARFLKVRTRALPPD